MLTAKLRETLMATTAGHVNYHDKVRSRIIDLLKQDSLTFTQLLERSLNCDPAILLRTIEELVADDTLRSFNESDGIVRYRSNTLRIQPLRSSCSRIIGGNGDRNRPATSHSTNNSEVILGDLLNSLSKPSPVYSQWWFSEKIYRKLLSLITALAKPSLPTAFLGCPTLGALFSRASQSSVTILDIDHIVLSSLSNFCSKSSELIHYDAAHPPDKRLMNAFQLVIIDPPWSTSTLKLFLARSASLVALGGRIVISFPQTLTRPSIPREREEFLKLADDLGFVLQQVICDATEYSVPYFEYNAYKQIGISLKEPWRKGDCFIFTKVKDKTFSEIHVVPERKYKWDQYRLDSSRVFLKRDGQDETGVPTISPIPQIEDFVYPATSSRSEAWETASLVTTSNCIARAHGRAELSRILGRISEGKFVKTQRLGSQPSGYLKTLESCLRTMLGNPDYIGREIS